MKEVYIAEVKSVKFDYDKPGDYDGCFPPALCPPGGHSFLFWDILRHDKVRQMDWACWVIKMNKREITAFLEKENADHDHKLFTDLVDPLFDFARSLNDEQDYLLVALEWGENT